ncbi:MAG: ABC transporter substrate-binding protein [Blautia sp.]|nr:ABC transporter substrate-binding protein [Blautia sp.]
MKNIVKRVLAMALTFSVLSAGAVTAMAEETRVTALKGPTAMGLVKLMDDSDKGVLEEGEYSFNIAAAIDLVTPEVVQGNTDIAALPANLASVLYNNTEGGVKVLAINTLGVLYIVGTGDGVASAEDLKGKTIYASGKGATPEYALSYILRENGIDPETDVTIEWKSEHSECLAALLADPEGIALLPQPFVTTAQMKNDQIKVLLDLTEEWDKLQADAETASGLITGVTVVRTAYAQEHPDEVEAFLRNYEASVSFVNENMDEAAAMTGAYDIVPEEVAKKALPACNITFVSGQEMKEKLSGYLEVLFEQNPAAVGNALPGDDFYYGAE